MMTQSVMSESTAHPDKTRGHGNTTTMMTLTKVNVTGAGVGRDGMVAEIWVSRLGVKRAGKGAKVRRTVVKGRIRSEFYDFPAVHKSNSVILGVKETDLKTERPEKRRRNV